MKTNYMQYEEMLKRERHINTLKANGFKLIVKRNRFKIGLGVSCLVVAIIPNGLGVLMLPLSLYLLGIKKTDLFLYKERAIRKLKLKFRGVLNSS